ncbi:glycosyltransferase 87 family protein [Cryobacterium sp. PH31-AA6]|uniref:glycosyltransferase 87 family protein n=1 Tax=Cryobacterium sp. PH31-AA6 TaxID=3046205 RepID=UPI0024B90780|nr:glycosyltransferase 87 family protein [Cryobacterium sp. PH31-AA6]MDJ0325453.1 glycosyltransferase 87 family protein [Cryobacterium sp. PH31-AA6]
MSLILDRADRRLFRAITPARMAWLHSPRALVLGFLAVHAVFLLALLPTILTGRVLGDLPLYRTWAENGLLHHLWQGITVEWVYPIGALLPIVLAGLGGPLLYQLLWFLMTMSLNALAVAALTDRGRDARGYRAAWLWLLISFVLSPVALLRLEGLTAPLVIIALVLLARRPVVAAALLTAATWIKVWPAAVMLAVVAVVRRRWLVAATGAAISLAIAGFVWAAGGIRFLTGFITMQSDRALQLEAPVTTPWVWLASAGRPGTVIYQNYAIATREVIGPGTTLVAEVMTPLMFLAVGAVLVLMLVGLRRGSDPTLLLLLGSLALVGAFIVFNKVGSPQYMLWLVPIVVVGATRAWRQWRAAAYLMLAISVLTTLIFPIFYLQLIDGDPLAVLLLTARNLLVIVLFGWSVRALVRLLKTSNVGAEAAAHAVAARQA